MIRNDELEAAEVESIWCGSRLPAEVLEVDQSSTHPGLSSASGSPGCSLRYTWHAVPGFSRAPNYAAAAARNEMLSFIDDDVLLPVDWFENLCSAVADQDARWVVTGRVEPATPEIAGGFSPSLQRLCHETPKYLSRSLPGLKTDRRQASGDAFFGIALFFGASEWLLRRSLAH